MKKDAAWFQGQIDVSRETLDRLKTYEALLSKWNPKINLVSPTTLPELWGRHFLDSAQLIEIAPSGDTWVDLGSGGGFPGLVVAAFLTGKGAKMTLVESDQRKSSFLRTVIRETDLQAEVIAQRLEEVPPLHADVLTARALAPLSRLLEGAERHMKKSGRALFLKGAKAQDEIAESLEHWQFNCVEHPSKTDVNSTVLSIGDIKRV